MLNLLWNHTARLLHQEWIWSSSERPFHRTALRISYTTRAQNPSWHCTKLAYTERHKINRNIDWLRLGFTSHPTQNRSFRRRSSQPISWLSTEKVKQTQQSKHASITKYTKHKIYPKKLMLDLVASYDLTPGNGQGLFWFRSFVKSNTFAYLGLCFKPKRLVNDHISSIFPPVTWIRPMTLTFELDLQVSSWAKYLGGISPSS